MIWAFVAVGIIGTVGGCQIAKNMADSANSGGGSETFSASFGYPSLVPGDGTKTVTANSVTACFSNTRGSVPVALCLHLLPTAPTKELSSPAGTMSIIEGDKRKNYEIGVGGQSNAWVLKNIECVNTTKYYDGVSCVPHTYSATFTNPVVAPLAACAGTVMVAKVMSGCSRDFDNESVSMLFCSGQTELYANKSPAITRATAVANASAATETCAAGDATYALDASSVVCNATFTKVASGLCDRLNSVAVLSGGSDDMACATSELGTASCWGITHGMSMGSIGNGSYREVTKLQNLKFKSLSLGTLACALTLDGSPHCVGHKYKDAGAGFVDTYNAHYSSNAGLTPLAPGELVHDFKQIESKGSAACGVTNSGKLFCWGDGTEGITGQGTDLSTEAPVAVTVPSVTFKKVSVGLRVACAIDSNDEIWCWGSNEDSLGQGGAFTDVQNPTAPVKVTGGHTFIDLSVSNDGVCAVKSDNTAYCWGRLTNGMGSNNLSTSPRLIAGTVAWSKIFTAQYEKTLLICGIDTSYDAHCMGYINGAGPGSLNNNGAFGDGTLVQPDGTATEVPVAVVGGLKFQSLSVGHGAYGACGVTTAGKVYCWGYDLGRMAQKDVSDSPIATGLVFSPTEIVIGL